MGLFKRKEKNVNDDFLKIIANALTEAEDNAQNVGKAIFAKQAPEKSNFGHSETNPIFTNSISGTEHYLSNLCTKDGEKFTWSPCTSIRVTIDEYQDIGEDMYTLYLNGNEYTKLYFVLYVGESIFPPAGLCFCDDDTDWDTEREDFSMGVPADVLLRLRKVKAENRAIREEEARKQISSKNDVDSNTPLFCRKCGTKLLSDSSFCYKCGEKVVLPKK